MAPVSDIKTSWTWIIEQRLLEGEVHQAETDSKLSGEEAEDTDKEVIMVDRRKWPQRNQSQLNRRRATGRYNQRFLSCDMNGTVGKLLCYSQAKMLIIHNRQGHELMGETWLW